MNFKTVKKGSDVVLAGIKVELELRDGQPRVLLLRDIDGHVVQVTSDYGIAVSVEAPPKLVARYRVKGSVGALAFDEMFQHEWQAKGRLGELGVSEETSPIEKVLVEE